MKNATKKSKRKPAKKHRANAVKMKRKAPKGWIKAKGVKITRKGGRVEVLIRK